MNRGTSAHSGVFFQSNLDKIQTFRWRNNQIWGKTSFFTLAPQLLYKSKERHYIFSLRVRIVTQFFQPICQNQKFTIHEKIDGPVLDIKTKRKAMDLKLRKMYWLVGRKSQLSLYNKLIIYKVIIKPISTDAKQLWGAACNSNLEITQRFQSKSLKLMLDVPWYVTNVSSTDTLR